MAGQFQDQVVMITGAGGFVARGVVEKFATEGAKLILVDVRQESLDRLVTDMADRLPEHLLLVGDLGDPAEIDRMVRESEAKFGAIHVLVHTAGGYKAGTPVHETDVSVFDQQIMLNARLIFVVCGRVAKHMVEHGVKGSIVAILARSALTGAKNHAAYTASKAAAQRIIESMALELRDHHIRVNGVMPSTVDTPANRQSMPDADFSKWVSPQQIADAIAFLASDAASAINGDSLPVYNRA